MGNIILIAFPPMGFTLLKVTSQEPYLESQFLDSCSPLLSRGGLGFPLPLLPHFPNGNFHSVLPLQGLKNFLHSHSTFGKGWEFHSSLLEWEFVIPEVYLPVLHSILVFFHQGTNWCSCQKVPTQGSVKNQRSFAFHHID